MVKGPPDQWNDHNVEQKDTINLDFLSDNRMGKHVNFIILKMYSSFNALLLTLLNYGEW